MQGADAENQAKFRSDEESINFRPSPNFKHMKKYLKSKFEEANQAMNDSSASQSASDSSSNGHDEREKVKKNGPVVQPPLPPNSPPPDTPPTPPIINLKKEIEDDEYLTTTTENPSEYSQPEEIMTENIKTDKSEASEKPDVIMCRNFVRGTCKKGAACIFVHELILSQLPGVYTFCRNFQNSVCTHPKCKFVHATVFEKEYFFRSGYLPPHTLAHLKEGNVQQPPPPPPPEEIPREVQVQLYSNPPPPASIPPRVKPLPVLNFAAAATGEPNDSVIFKVGQSPATLPKREWSKTEPSTSSPRDLESSEPLAKQCKTCDSNTFRCEFSKAKLEQLMESNAEIRKKINLLNKKNSKLTYVLGTLFKQNGSNSNGFNTSALAADIGGNGVANQLKAFLAKLFLKPDAPPDAS